jgi:hypothetical protein
MFLAFYSILSNELFTMTLDKSVLVLVFIIYYKITTTITNRLNFFSFLIIFNLIREINYTTIIIN